MFIYEKMVDKNIDCIIYINLWGIECDGGDFI